jgi:hypothetical protein
MRAHPVGPLATIIWLARCVRTHRLRQCRTELVALSLLNMLAHFPAAKRVDTKRGFPVGPYGSAFLTKEFSDKVEMVCRGQLLLRLG